MITKLIPKTWQDLQNEVAKILSECDFDVDIAKKIRAARSRIEIDVYAREKIFGRKYSVACECKHWKSRIPQSIVHAFRTVVAETGTNMGYLISLKGFQSGSLNAAELTNLKLVTWEQFQQEFEKCWLEKYFSPTLEKRLAPLFTYCEPLSPRWFEDLSEFQKDAYINLKKKYDIFAMVMEVTFSPYSRMIIDTSVPPLPLANRLQDVPDSEKAIFEDFLEIDNYREFLHKVSKFGEKAISEFRFIKAIGERNSPKKSKEI